MNKETKERIEKDASQFIKNNRDGHYLAGPYHWMSYVCGATSEHPKAWNEAIDKCIERIDTMIDQQYLELGNRSSYSVIKKTLESLKL